MRLQMLGFALVFSAPLLAVDDFTIVSDTKVKLHGEVYKGSCDALKKKEKDVNKESGLLGSLKNRWKDLKEDMEMGECDTVGPVTLAAKKGTTRSEITIQGGQWAVFFKDLSSAEGYIPAICHANISKPGRILLLQTPKSETARGILGKSMGFGLKCTQVERLPKD